MAIMGRTRIATAIGVRSGFVPTSKGATLKTSVARQNQSRRKMRDAARLLKGIL